MARILLVDDNAAVREAILSCLESEGHSVIPAADENEAVCLIGCEPADLVLLDVNVPTLSGLRLCRALKAHPDWRQAPVVMMTGSPTRDIELRARAAGADAVLAKPFDRQSLDAILDSRLR
jgi:CheY-like chemotaxis protein